MRGDGLVIAVPEVGHGSAVFERERFHSQVLDNPAGDFPGQAEPGMVVESAGEGGPTSQNPELGRRISKSCCAQSTYP